MAFSKHDPGYGRKLAGLSVVVLVHVAVIYALLNGLGQQIISAIKASPIEVKLIDEVKLSPPSPPVIASTPKPVTPQRPFIPTPPAQAQQSVTPPVIQTVADAASPPPPSEARVQSPAAEPAKATSVVSAVVDFMTCSKPDYPRTSLRNEEQGVVRIRFLIGADGQVADSKIEKSSGFRTLDSAAKNALRLCKFKPGTINGVPQQSWTVVDYVWKLPD